MAALPLKTGVIGAFLALVAGTGFLTVAAVAQTQQPLRPYSLSVDTGTKTATATAGAATLAKNAGTITTESLSTAAGATYTLTLTDTVIAATDEVMVSVAYGTSTTGTPVVTRVQPASGSLVILIQNIHASAAFNGTLKISFVAFEQ